jgi:hypothetical protein
MKPMKNILIVALLALSTATQGQVIISLLFGEALNTDKIEFGLTGGLNRSYILDIEESEGMNNFNLGFYFHIRMNPNSFISTGVLVKSNVGAQGMPTYATGDPSFDGLFQDGELTKKINIFYVPIMWQQRIKGRWLLEGGIQPGLRSKAYDIFDVDYSEGEISYKNEVGHSYTRLDFGVVGGAGYKLTSDLKSMSLGVLYYHGLVDMSTDPSAVIKNSSLNIYFRIPIGAAKK